MLDAAESSYSSPGGKTDVRRRIGYDVYDRIELGIDISEKKTHGDSRQTRELERARRRGNKCVTIGVIRTSHRTLVAQPSTINFGSCSFRKLTVVRAKMNLSVGTPILCFLLVALLSEVAYARPSDWLLSRQKRLSDQRLAELETLLALQNVKGVVVPVGFGKVNPAILGRKRRSISEDNLRKLHHLLLLIAQDAESTVDQSDQFRPLPWKEDPREEQRDYQLI